jgi:hypothetical protein
MSCHLAYSIVERKAVGNVWKVSNYKYFEVALLLGCNYVTSIAIA